MSLGRLTPPQSPWEGLQVTNFDLCLHIMKEKSPMQQHKHKKRKKKKKKKREERRWRKEDCFPKLVINIDQHLNEALTLLVHTIT